MGSIALVILDLTISSENFSIISRIFRGIFRFLRIFLLFRKVIKNNKFDENIVFLRQINLKEFKLHHQTMILGHQ